MSSSPSSSFLVDTLPVLSLDIHAVLFVCFMTAILSITVIFSIRTYLSVTCGKCTSSRMLVGKTVIITGSNTGIGKETARDLARRGARVLLACRNIQTAREAAKEIIASTGNSQVLAKKCDLSSFKSIRNFADDILSSEKTVDILILNAGSGSPFGRHLTEDGIELQFQTNHLGHFLLVNLLLDRMKESAISNNAAFKSQSSSRIVVTSSLAHRFGRIDLENIATASRYINHPFLTYCDTKLCNLLFTKELSRKLMKESGPSPLVTVNSLHPGTIYTNSIKYNEIWYVKVFLTFMCFLYGGRSEEEGAQTIIHLAVSEDVEGITGGYFSDCRLSSYNPTADDTDLAKKLWSLSEKSIGVQES